MQIRDIQLNKAHGDVVAEARVVWEDCDRPPLTIQVAVEERFCDVFNADANGFLALCVLPAWHAGERRVVIHDAICPVLAKGLRAPLSLLASWFPEMGTPPIIELAAGTRVLPPAPGASLSFLSCGIDSLATLRWNRLHLPADHPASIQAAVMVDFGGAEFMTKQEAENKYRLAAGHRVASDLGVRLIPLRTNVLSLDGDGWFFSYKWHGALLSALAYFFSRAFRRACIAASDDAAHLEPWGSHPLLDTYYSSAHLQIEHHGTFMTRFEKVALVADWPAGLRSILVCQGAQGGDTNCGTCEKCILTMTALTALGKLHDSQSFPADNVTPELLKTVLEYGMIENESQGCYYSELLRPLKSAGRNDLASIIEELILPYARQTSAAESNLGQLPEVIRSDTAFVIAHANRFGGQVPGYPMSHYWGQPASDAHAARELRHWRDGGAVFVIIPRELCWWLDHYEDFRATLESNGRRLIDRPEFVLFELGKNISRLPAGHCRDAG